MQERFESALGPGTQLLSAAGRTRSTAEMSQAFMTNLTAMSLLALLVGLFLIFNAVNFSVLQRRGLIGVLRALGLTRRQLLSMILAEAAAVGLFAAVAGVMLGTVLGEQLLQLVSRTINDLYFRVNVTDVTVGPFSVAKGLVGGVGAALVAAALPALEATSYRPRLALTRSAIEKKARHALPAVTLGGIAGMGAAVVLILLSGTSLVAGLAAVFLLILGFALCVPLFVRLSSTLAAPLAGKLGGTSARMAAAGVAARADAAGRRLHRNAARRQPGAGVDRGNSQYRRRRGHEHAQARLGGRWARPHAAARVRDAAAELLGRRTHRCGPGRGLARLGKRRRRIRLRALRLPERRRRRRQHRPADGPRAPAIRGRRHVPELRHQRERHHDEHFRDASVDSLGLYLDAGTDTDAVVAAISQLSEGRQQLYINSNAGLRDESLRIFDRTFVITDVLYWLTLGVAFIGILSAMLALQLERAREFATLRALGMTPGQVGGMITAQTGFIGLLSGLAAIPLGAPDILFTSVVFAIGAALLAGLYPAWRAGQSQPAIAMREE
jgi:putative ABC transport system permease protein